MIIWSLLFMIIAAMAGVLGATQMSGAHAWLAQALFIVLTIFALFLLAANRRPPMA